jgi:hypothetical protein
VALKGVSIHDKTIVYQTASGCANNLGANRDDDRRH